jgi:hypothetical protein
MRTLVVDMDRNPMGHPEASAQINRLRKELGIAHEIQRRVIIRHLHRKESLHISADIGKEVEIGQFASSQKDRRPKGAENDIKIFVRSATEGDLIGWDVVLGDDELGAAHIADSEREGQD